MSEQPEALRLADALEALNGAKKLLPCVGGETLGTEVYRIRLSGSDAGELLDAAAELRRLHAEIERLTAAWRRQHARKVEERSEAKLWFENAQKLQAVNAELLEALQLALSAHGRMLLSDPPQDAWKAQGVEEKARAAIRAAIARAEEVKPPRIEGYNTNRDQPTFTIKEVKP